MHLLAQIPRFQVTGEGFVHKHSLQLNMRSMQTLQLPVFTEPDTISVRWVFKSTQWLFTKAQLLEKATIELLECIRTGLGHSGIPMTGRGPSMRPR